MYDTSYIEKMAINLLSGCRSDYNIKFYKQII